MRQVLLEIPGLHLKVYGFGVMLCLAFFAGIGLAARQARRQGLNPESVYDLALWFLIGGLVGARLFYVWQYWGTRIQSLSEIPRIWEGGIVLYGGVMGATAASLAYWLRARFPLRPTLDALAPAIALGLAFGRLGCFLNGCCYGDECQLPWALTFPASSPPWSQQVHQGDLIYPDAKAPGPWAPYVDLSNGRGQPQVVPDPAARSSPVPGAAQLERREVVDPDGRTTTRTVRAVSVSLRSHPVHPTQVYSALDGLILMSLLLAYAPLKRHHGEVMALLMVTYPVTRTLIEQLRGDEAAFFAGLTVSQNVSVLIFLAGLAYWVYLRRLPPEPAGTVPSV